MKVLTVYNEQLGYVDVLVDAEDYDKIRNIRWHVKTRMTAAGEVVPVRVQSSGWKSERLNLHRVILGLSEYSSDAVVDHVNGDPLDNRKLNLRVCASANNTRNSRRQRTHQYKGVHARPSGRFRAVLKVNYEYKHLGTFGTAEEAAKAYDEAALAAFGEFARLNFPRR